MKGFKNIYYDRYDNKMYLWEINEEDKTTKTVIRPSISYYIPDVSGESEIHDIWGNPVKLQTTRNMHTLKSTLEFSGIKTCEATLDQDIKYLQNKYANKKLVFDMADFQVCTIDIEVETGDDPKPFDQMVEDCDNVVNLISVHYSKEDKIYVYGNQPYTGHREGLDKNLNIEFHYIPDEKTLLETFIKNFRKKHVDIITGWNSSKFDMRYLIDRCDKLDIELSFSPINKYIETHEINEYKEKIKYYKIAGISVLDGMELYKKFKYKKEVSYKLNYIGHKVVGEGKIELDDQINSAYKTNWNQFVEYNIQDVLLTKKINDKTKFIPLTITLSYQALIPFDGIFSQIKLITGYMLNYLHRHNLVMPDPDDTKKEPYPGAYVKALRGLHKYILAYDFESLYPKIMMMYNISPETLRYCPDESEIEELIKTPASEVYKCLTPKGKFEVSGIYYTKEKKGIIPQIVETIFEERKYFKNKMKIAIGVSKNLSPEKISENTHIDLDYVKTLYGEVIEEQLDADYYNNQQMIRKILINSIYGVLGNKHFAFYNIKNAMAITIGGRHVIEFVSDSVNKYFKTQWHKTFHKYFPEYEGRDVKPITKDMVPLIDTDSSHICLDEVIKSLGLTFKDNEEYRLWANNFDEKFMAPFFNKILDIYAKNFNTENVHNFKKEKVITSKMVLKKKKYADIVLEKEGDIYSEPKLDITGIDIVKTSTSSFSKNALTNVLKTMLLNEDKEEIAEILREYRPKYKKSSNINDIAFPRSVNNYYKYASPVDEYVKNGITIVTRTPQQIKASIYYNYLIKTKKLEYPFICNGSKIKLLYVNPNNILQTDIIAYVGEYPKEFEKIFSIDYKAQWYKGFIKLIEDFYDAFGWGEVIIEKNNIMNIIKI